MPRTPAKITQADVARAVRAAKQAGASGVDIKPDGTISIRLSPTIFEEADPVEIDGDREIIL